MTVHPKEPEFCQQYTKPKLLSPDKLGYRKLTHYRIFNFSSKAKHLRQQELDKRRGFAENRGRRTKSEVLRPLAARPKLPWLPVHSLPFAPKLNLICAGGWLRLLPTGIAMHLNWCPRAFRRWMHWWGDCRAER